MYRSVCEGCVYCPAPLDYGVSVPSVRFVCFALYAALASSNPVYSILDYLLCMYRDLYSAHVVVCIDIDMPGRLVDNESKFVFFNVATLDYLYF